MPCFWIVSSKRDSAKAAPLGPGQHPARHVAAEDVDDGVEVVVGPLLRAVEFGDVPAVHRVGCGGHQFGFHPGRVCGVASAVTHLVVLVQHPVHGRDRSEIGPFVKEFGVDGGRGLIDVLDR